MPSSRVIARRAGLALALLLVLARPAAAQIAECPDPRKNRSPENFRIFCFTNRLLWDLYSRNADSPGRYFVDFNDFITEPSFDDAPLSLGPLEQPLPFTLGVVNGPYCSPGNCLFHSANYIQLVGVAPFDPTVDQISPFVHAIVNCKKPDSDGFPRACTEDSIEVSFVFDASVEVNAFGADFASANTGEGTDLEVILSDGSTFFVPVAPVLQPGDLTLSGFFGVLIDDLGNDLRLREVRFVPRTELPGSEGEEFGMDNIGNIPACTDGLDNDGDGDTDFPGDAGCHSSNDLTEVADCQDGLDNDFDGKTDFPEDTGCRDAADGSEGTDCDDGIDNDGDGRVDFATVPAARDPGCDDAEDPDETSPDLACDNGMDDDCDGLTDWGSAADGDPGCSFADDVPDTPAPGTLYGSERDADVDVRCDNGLDDDGDGRTDFGVCTADGLPDPECSSVLDDSEGVDCADDMDNDGDGRIDFPDDTDCRDATDPSEVPDCDDGLDNDGDGDTDFPAEADCTSVLDQSELPDCSDAVDNDGDGATDYPDDMACTGPEDQTELGDCLDGIDNDGDGLVDFGVDPGCESVDDGSETTPDVDCDNGIDDDGDGRTDVRIGSELDDPGCETSEDDSELNLSFPCDNGSDDDRDGAIDVGGGGVDGASGDAGCSSPLDVSEGFACADGLDNDGDGHTDYYAPDPRLGDPGCESEMDDDELTDCGIDDIDIDGDAVCDRDDNCLFVFNPAPQADTNDNGLGNACDPDFDGNGYVDGRDFTRLRASLASEVGDPNYDPDVDVDCNGAIAARDFNALRSAFGLRPGVSGCQLLGGGCPPRTPDQLTCPTP